MTDVPFRPRDPWMPGLPMPPTVPPGLRLELSRSKLVPGQEREAEAWMSMLTERYEECVATLSDQRAVFEATFLHEEADGSTWIYHLALTGQEGRGLDPESSDIDRAHDEYGRRVKMRGWEELQPMFMLTPEHLRSAMETWGRTGRP